MPKVTELPPATSIDKADTFLLIQGGTSKSARAELVKDCHDHTTENITDFEEKVDEKIEEAIETLVKKTGDNMTGPLVGTTGTFNNLSATSCNFDTLTINNGSVSIDEDATDQEITNAGFVISKIDEVCVSKDGDTMTGTLTGTTGIFDQITAGTGIFTSGTINIAEDAIGNEIANAGFVISKIDSLTGSYVAISGDVMTGTLTGTTGVFEAITVGPIDITNASDMRLMLGITETTSANATSIPVGELYYNTDTNKYKINLT